jgi:RNA polymerase sigma factor (sigma-70 family)
MDSDFIDIYYNDLSRVTILDKVEEKKLLLAYNEPSTSEEVKHSIKCKVIESNLRLVFGMAKGMWDKKDPDKLQELIANGNLGLIQALGKFDPSYGVRFCTYAGHWVLMSMRKTFLSVVKTPLDRSQPVYEEESYAPEEPYLVDYDQGIQELQRTAYINLWLRFLSDRERFIIRESFLRPDHTTRSLREMAQDLKLSSERVRQLKATAIAKLSLWLSYHYSES